MAQQKFWMVLGEGTPTFRHASKQSAITEAERLARFFPRRPFVVLESLATVCKTDVSWEPHEGNREELEDMTPF